MFDSSRHKREPVRRPVGGLPQSILNLIEILLETQCYGQRRAVKFLTGAALQKVLLKLGFRVKFLLLFKKPWGQCLFMKVIPREVFCS